MLAVLLFYGDRPEGSLLLTKVFYSAACTATSLPLKQPIAKPRDPLSAKWTRRATDDPTPTVPQFKERLLFPSGSVPNTSSSHNDAQKELAIRYASRWVHGVCPYKND